MKTAVIDISHFLDYLKNEHLTEIIEQSQTKLMGETLVFKFNPQHIRETAILSLKELYAFAAVKFPSSYFDNSLTSEEKITIDKYCQLKIHLIQKNLLFQYISDFTIHAEEALSIYKELDKYYSQRQTLLVEEIYNEYKQVELLSKEQEEQIQKISKESQHFAYAASHDLQEPLRMITSYLQIVSNRYKDKLDSEGVEFIGIALDGSTRMKNLINGLLEFSRLNNLIDFKKMNTNAVLSSVLENLNFYIKESNAEIKSDDLPDLIADPNLIAKLFQHLISNAIKFKNNDPLRIKIFVDKTDSAYRFGVQDNGIGIQKEYFDKIFVIFQRLHSKNKYPGTGIGLAVCKKIVEQHGGTMWVESEVNKGTTFYFTIPFEPVLTKKRSID